MKITLKRSRDVLTPDLAARMQRAKNPRKALEAMGLTVVSMALRAFTQPSLRPSPWLPLKVRTILAKKKAGFGSKPLIRSGALAHSPRVVTVTGSTVTVGSDRKAGGQSLAAVHQFGTKDGHIPARPVWPFDKLGRPTTAASRNLKAAAKAALKLER